MEELIGILSEIRDQLAELNNKIDYLTSNGVLDIVNAIEEIKGKTGYDLTDVCSKLDQIDTTIEGIKGNTGYDLTDIYSKLDQIDTTIEGIKGNTGYDLTDVCSKLDQIDLSLMMKD